MEWTPESPSHTAQVALADTTGGRVAAAIFLPLFAAALVAAPIGVVVLFTKRWWAGVLALALAALLCTLMWTALRYCVRRVRRRNGLIELRNDSIVITDPRMLRQSARIDRSAVAGIDVLPAFGALSFTAFASGEPKAIAESGPILDDAGPPHIRLRFSSPQTLDAHPGLASNAALQSLAARHKAVSALLLRVADPATAAAAFTAWAGGPNVTAIEVAAQPGDVARERRKARLAAAVGLVAVAGFAYVRLAANSQGPRRPQPSFDIKRIEEQLEQACRAVPNGIGCPSLPPPRIVVPTATTVPSTTPPG